MEYKNRHPRCEHGFLKELCLILKCPFSPKGRTRDGEAVFKWASVVHRAYPKCGACNQRYTKETCDCELKFDEKALKKYRRSRFGADYDDNANVELRDAASSAGAPGSGK